MIRDIPKETIDKLMLIDYYDEYNKLYPRSLSYTSAQIKLLTDWFDKPQYDCFTIYYKIDETTLLNIYDNSEVVGITDFEDDNNIARYKNFFFVFEEGHVELTYLKGNDVHPLDHKDINKLMQLEPDDIIPQVDSFMTPMDELETFKILLNWETLNAKSQIKLYKERTLSLPLGILEKDFPIHEMKQKIKITCEVELDVLADFKDVVKDVIKEKISTALSETYYSANAKVNFKEAIKLRPK